MQLYFSKVELEITLSRANEYVEDDDDVDSENTNVSE
jgi:hypothetical protein